MNLVACTYKANNAFYIEIKNYHLKILKHMMKKYKKKHHQVE